jgi:hypothetical protein
MNTKKLRNIDEIHFRKSFCYGFQFFNIFMVFTMLEAYRVNISEIYRHGYIYIYIDRYYSYKFL